MTVRPQTVPFRVRFLGQTEASETVEMRARVAGYLMERGFNEGDRVTKGQQLFQIDPEPFKVELAQAEAAVASAEATLDRARSQVKRFQGMVAKGVGSPEELGDWQTQARVAAAQVQQQKAAAASTELELGYTSISAPITGVIGQVMKDPGSYVDAGQNGLLAVLQQVDPIEVRFSVTEQETLRFQRQRKSGEVRSPEMTDLQLEIILADGSIYPHLGRISFVDVEVDQTTGTSVRRGRVPNPEGLLKPGQFIYAHVLGVEQVGVFTVPQSAVSQSPAGPSVFVVSSSNTVESRPVKLGQWPDSNFWIVEDGVRPGDRVITDRLMTLRPGVPVTVAGEYAPSTHPATRPASAGKAQEPQTAPAATTAPAQQGGVTR
jgi:membrane fusion protein (multidrug efflux system)